jgi:hypothetical protein
MLDSFAWIEYVMKLKAKTIRKIFEEKASIFFFFLSYSISQLGLKLMRKNGKDGNLYIGLKIVILWNFKLFLWNVEILIV